MAKYFLCSIVSQADHTEANNVAGEIFPDSSGDNFTIPFSATGDYPATRYGSNAAITEEQRLQLHDINAETRLPSVLWWLYDMETSELIKTNSPTAESRIGQEWSFPACEADANANGLYKISVGA